MLPKEVTAVLYAVPPWTIMIPPLTVAESARPPRETIMLPPVLTTALFARPLLPTLSLPVLSTEMTAAVPPERRSMTPPELTDV